MGSDMISKEGRGGETGKKDGPRHHDLTWRRGHWVVQIRGWSFGRRRGVMVEIEG